MKKMFLAIVLCSTVALQSFANHDVVVNHNNKTVTILANFVSPAPIEKSMLKAADLWNNRNGKDKCIISVNGQDKEYLAYFKILINSNPLSDTAVNVITVIPDNHEFFAQKNTKNENGEYVLNRAISVNDGKTIGISNGFKNNKYVLAHEMGHALGLKHKDSGKCCHFSSADIAVFQLSESVTNLANNSQSSKNQTRKLIEIGSNINNFIANLNK
jgi:hypothetical protein